MLRLDGVVIRQHIRPVSMGKRRKNQRSCSYRAVLASPQGSLNLQREVRRAANDQVALAAFWSG